MRVLFLRNKHTFHRKPRECAFLDSCSNFLCIHFVYQDVPVSNRARTSYRYRTFFHLWGPIDRNESTFLCSHSRVVGLHAINCVFYVAGFAPGGKNTEGPFEPPDYALLPPDCQRLVKPVRD
jgi:hypothetical protein